MSGECDRCGEHCLDCECVNITKAYTTSYYFLAKQDIHIVNLFNWIRTLEILADQVGESDMDSELEEELKNIVNRLTREVGARVVAVFEECPLICSKK